MFVENNTSGPFEDERWAFRGWISETDYLNNNPEPELVNLNEVYSGGNYDKLYSWHEIENIYDNFSSMAGDETGIEDYFSF
jgi:hypothetical protein